MVAKKKLPAMMKWIDNYLEDTTQKLLFFLYHKSIVNALHARYKYISVIVTGKVKGKRRQQAFDQFNKDKRTRILFGNIQAAGVGWNCTATHNTAIGELPWTPGELEQLEDRTHGLKRGVVGKHSNYWYLIGNNTIEVPKCRILQRKSKILDSVLDGKRQTDSLDIFDLLAKHLKEQHK
jgi:SWI/SNF-related matrix-associated actin-dependent regulator 1 of chromatin subfamily A